MGSDSELEIFHMDTPSRSPSPENVHSPISISSADSRSSTARPASPKPPLNQDTTPNQPSWQPPFRSIRAPATRPVQPSASDNPALWSEPAIALTSVDKVPSNDKLGIDNAASERLRVAAVLKSIGSLNNVSGSGSNPALQSFQLQQLILLERNRKRLKMMMPQKDDTPGGSMSLPGVSSIVGGSKSSDPPAIHGNPVRDLPSPVSPHPGDPERVLDARELGYLLTYARDRKRWAEERLETFKSRPSMTPAKSSDGEPEGLEHSFQRSQKLFAIAQAQLQHQLGMKLSDQEEELANLDQSAEETNEQSIRDDIFVEAIKMELLTLQILTTKRKALISQAQAQSLALFTKEEARKETAAANSTALRFAVERARSSKFAESKQEIRRKEQRDARYWETDELPHKSPLQANPPTLEKVQPVAPPSRPPVQAATQPGFFDGVLRPSSSPSSSTTFPDTISRLPPSLAPGTHYLPPRPSDASAAPCSRPPPPPPIWPPPGIRPPGSIAPPSSGPPPLPNPVIPLTQYRSRPGQSSSSRVPAPIPVSGPVNFPSARPDLVPKPVPNIPTPAGISVKTFTSIEGSTTTTMTTNPDFEAKNGIEIVTKTIRDGDVVTTFTTTTLIPCVMRDGKLKKS